MRRLPLLLAVVVLTVGACGGGGDQRVIKLQDHGEVTTVDAPSTFASTAVALRYIRRHVDVPVALPALPAGTSLAKNPVYVSVANGLHDTGIELKLSDGSDLQIHFGRAGFDGCGGDDAESVRIGHRPGMMLATHATLAGTNKPLYNTQIIWPATPQHMEGLYGIYTQLPAGQTLKLARSMERALRAANRSAPEAGC